MENSIIGTAFIQEFINNNTLEKPGVYHMLSQAGEILYIGKAKNLKNRLSNYARLQANTNRIARMIVQVADVKIIFTRTEAEALLLEANLIKRHKPRYNILLRDDKSFPYIEITAGRFPRIKKHRGKKKKGHSYYGPFTNTTDAKTAMQSVQRAFLLRPCADGVFKNRTRACLEYQIKRCAGPCVGKISEAEYHQLVERAKKFVSGKQDFVKKELEEQMMQASKELEYETAAKIRDRIKAIASIQQRQDVNFKNIANADVIALKEDANIICLQMIFIRAGNLMGSKSYFPKIPQMQKMPKVIKMKAVPQSTQAQSNIAPQENSAPSSIPSSASSQLPNILENSASTQISIAQEVIENFIGQFYQKNEPPKEIILSQDVFNKNLLEEAISSLHNIRVKIITPIKGERRNIIEFALKNAIEAIEKKQKEDKANEEIFLTIQRLFNIPTEINRIEVYDNSHLFGKNAVGVMIVVDREGFVTNEYRRFNLKPQADYKITRLNKSVKAVKPQVKGGDDFAMMNEMLTRRLAQLQQDVKQGNHHKKPSLILIDGGKGQISAVQKVFTELNISDIPYIGIAKGEYRNKGEETFHMPNNVEWGFNKQKWQMKRAGQMEKAEKGKQAEKGEEEEEDFAKLDIQNHIDSCDDGLKLMPRSPILYFLQRIRDEAHRFAITTHRKQRSKNITKSELDKIPGIGAKRKKALFGAFGSVGNIKEATIEELAKTEGINKDLAKNIKDWLE